MKFRRGVALLGAVLLLGLFVLQAPPASAALLSPTLNSVTPSQIVPGVSNQVVTLHGDFPSGQSTVAFGPPDGITEVGSPTTVNSSTITVTVNVAADAPNTARDVTVTGGVLGASSTCSKCITVGPDITSVSGPIANTNGSAGFTITGHAFASPVTVTLSRSGYGFAAAETDSIIATSVVVSSDGTSLSGIVNMVSRAPGRWKISISQQNGGKASFGDGVTTGIQVTGGKPTLATISPTRIDSSKTDMPFTLTGSGFAQGMTATVTGSGVTQSQKTMVSSDMMHATLTLTSTSSPTSGPQTIVLHNADGQTSTNDDAICVNCNLSTPGAPTISTVTPQIVGQGASNLQMIVTGTNFSGPLPTVTVAPNTTDANAITIGVTRDSATQLTLSLTVPTGAATGDRSLTVSNSGGTATKAAAFNVHSDFQVVNLNPPGRPQGFTGLDTIQGAGFAGTPTVTISGPSDVTVGQVAIDGPARIKFQVTVGANAATTARDVSVTQGGVTKTCTGCFTVGKNPTVASITPNAASGGGPASITAINGTNFAPGATATLEQAGQPNIVMTESSVNGSGTAMSGTFDLTNAAPGMWSVRVTNVDGGNDVLPNAFDVTQAAPFISDATPDSLPQAAQTTVTLTGTSFAPGMTVTFPTAQGLTVDDVTRTSNTSAVVKVTASDTAVLGARDILVKNTDGQSYTCQSCVVVVQGQQARYFGPGITAYENFDGGAFVAAGNLDGVPSNGPEFVTAPNAGGGPHIKPYRVNPGNGAIQELGVGFMAYDQNFAGGVHVAIGNLDGNTANGEEIITGAGPGGGPHVRIWHINNDLSVSEPFGNGFFAYDPGFSGGVYVAAADVDGDGKDEIITGAGPGGGPHVRVWKLAPDGQSFTPIAGWMAYDPLFNGGVAVAGGNFVAEGSDTPTLDEIATVPSFGGGPHVRVWSGGGAVERQFMAFDSSDPRGYRIAGGDFNFDTIDDLAVSQVSTTYVLIAQLVDSSAQYEVLATPQPLGAALPIGTNMAAADVDGDGDADLIVSPDHDSAVTVRLTRPLS